jgi:hypothetical protein
MLTRILFFSVSLFLGATPCHADWGESWGSMAWGANAPAVPVLGAPGLLVLVFLFLAIGAVAQRRGVGKIALFALVVLAPAVALGVPHVFQNGTVADADEVNENFSDLESALPVLAFSGETSTSRHASAGTSSAVLGSTTDRVCFLTSVQFEDVDNNAEFAACRVVVSGSDWVLQAALSVSADTDVWCSARCLTW